MVIVKFLYGFNSVLKQIISNVEHTYSHFDQFAFNQANSSNNQLCALLSNRVFNRSLVGEVIENEYENVSVSSSEKSPPIVAEEVEIERIESKDVFDLSENSNSEVEVDEEDELVNLIDEHDKQNTFSKTEVEQNVEIEKIGEVVVDNKDGNLEVIETIKPDEINLKAPISLSSEVIDTEKVISFKIKKTKSHKLNAQNNMFLLNNTSKLNDFNKWLLHQKPLEESNTPNIIKLNKKRKKLSKLKKLEKITLPSLENQSNIVSESLAKILAKQGYREEAIEMYRQLSLNIPEKSDFFAAQIEELKNK